MQDNRIPKLFGDKKGDILKKNGYALGKRRKKQMKIKSIFENIFLKKEEEIQEEKEEETELIEEEIQKTTEPTEKEIQPTTEKVEEETEEIQEENQQEIQPKEKEKEKNLTKILSDELRKTERMNIRFSKYTLNLLTEKIKKITKKENISNTEMVNFIVAFFLQNENKLNKEPIKILSKNKKKYKITFKLSQEEIEYIFSQCVKKGINIEQGCFQILQKNGIGKNTKNQIYRLLMSEIHSLSSNQEEKKFIENLKQLKEINRKIIELKNFQFFNFLSGENLKDKFEEVVEEVTKMSEPIKQISSFLRKI